MKTAERIVEKLVRDGLTYATIAKIGPQKIIEQTMDVSRGIVVINKATAAEFFDSIEAFLGGARSLVVAKCKNLMPLGDGYTGFNVTLLDDKQLPFEIQFHTPASYAMKNRRALAGKARKVVQEVARELHTNLVARLARSKKASGDPLPAPTMFAFVERIASGPACPGVTDHDAYRLSKIAAFAGQTVLVDRLLKDVRLVSERRAISKSGMKAETLRALPVALRVRGCTSMPPPATNRT